MPSLVHEGVVHPQEAFTRESFTTSSDTFLKEKAYSAFPPFLIDPNSWVVFSNLTFRSSWPNAKTQDRQKTTVSAQIYRFIALKILMIEAINIRFLPKFLGNATLLTKISLILCVKELAAFWWFHFFE